MIEALAARPEGGRVEAVSLDAHDSEGTTALAKKIVDAILAKRALVIA